MNKNKVQDNRLKSNNIKITLNTNKPLKLKDLDYQIDIKNKRTNYIYMLFTNDEYKDMLKINMLKIKGCNKEVNVTILSEQVNFKTYYKCQRYTSY